MCEEDYVILFRGSFRGGEVLLREGRELVKIVNDGKLYTAALHVVVPLMGGFKG